MKLTLLAAQSVAPTPKKLVDKVSLERV